jgi:hypothetical protein
MKLQFERLPGAICAVLVAPGECDRIANVARASDAFDALALDVDAGAFAPLNALFVFARVVCVELERRGDGWRAEVVYWSGGLGTLAQYETDAATLTDALTRCVRALLG